MIGLFLNFAAIENWYR